MSKTIEKVPTLYIMCGCAGVGKDYFIAHGPISNVTCVSRDKIRFSFMNKQDEYFAHEKEVFETFIDKIVSELYNGKDVIANATHLNFSSRKKLINSINRRFMKRYHIVYYVLVSPIDVILRQNSQREGLEKVPETTILEMYKSFEIPQYSESRAIKDIYIKEYNKDLRRL